MIETLMVWGVRIGLILVCAIAVYGTWRLTPFFLSIFDRVYKSPAEILGWRLKATGTAVVFSALFIWASFYNPIFEFQKENVKDTEPLIEQPDVVTEPKVVPPEVVKELQQVEAKQADIKTEDDGSVEAEADHQLYDVENNTKPIEEKSPEQTVQAIPGH